MRRIQLLRLLSIAGALLVGIWLPLRMIGYVTASSLELGLDVTISVISAINLHLYFAQPGRNWREAREWLTPGVVSDVLCLLPLALVVHAVFGVEANALLFVNLLAARHIQKVKLFLDEFDSLQPIVYRLVPLLTLLPIIVHLAACGWLALGSGTAEQSPDHVLQYVRAVYWAFTTLTTVGYGDIAAKSIPQMLYCCVVQITGVGIFGYILSNVASLLSRSDAAREHHMDNLERIERFMTFHQTPRSLRSSVRAYYHYLWMNKKGYQDRSIMEGLPSKIQSDLFFHINRPIIEKVPFLKGAKRELLEDLTAALEPRILVPGERVFRVDEPGDALYFIQGGEVEIVSRENRQIVILREGAFFGEMALLSERPRNATAIAVGFSEVFVLRRQAFDRVTEAYPDFKRHIAEVVKLRSAA